MEIETITLNEVKRLLAEGLVTLIDVREEEEFSAGYIPGSLWIPLNSIADLTAMWPAEQPIAVICNTDNRSAAACRLLIERGFRRVYLVESGVSRWEGQLNVREPSAGRLQALDRKVYLDNASTTPLDPHVASAMWWCLQNGFGNPSSIHSLGRAVRTNVRKARGEVARLLNCQPGELIFTSGGTEADQTALWGLTYHLPPQKKRVITSAIEHPAILQNLKLLRTWGFEISLLSVDRNGLVSPDELRSLMDDSVGLVSVMLANNEVGTIQPVEELVDIAHHYGALFHTDAVQAVPHLDIDLANLPVDALSLSGHKLHGPKGIGVLFVREGTPFAPLIGGGGQESGRRSGTENTPGIIGLGVACSLLRENRFRSKKIAEWRDYLEERLRRHPGVTIFGHPTKRLPNILTFAVRGKPGAELVLDLDVRGIAASSGSACSGGKSPSHVLKAMGFAKAAEESVRLSFGRYNTFAEIEYVANELTRLLAK